MTYEITISDATTETSRFLGSMHFTSEPAALACFESLKDFQTLEDKVTELAGFQAGFVRQCAVSLFRGSELVACELMYTPVGNILNA